MVKYILIIFLNFSISAVSLAQKKELPKYRVIPQNFKTYYNKGDYKSIYILFSPDFQKNISDITLKIRLSELKLYVGKIKDFEYVTIKDSIAYKFNLGEGNFLTILIKPDLKINQLILNRPKNKEYEDVYFDNRYSDGTALQKGSKNDSQGYGTGDVPSNQGSIYGDPLAPNYGGGGYGNYNNPIPLGKFKNLIMPKVSGQETGKIVVKIRVNRNGQVISATAGAKGTTFSNDALFRKCERAVMNATLDRIENGPEVRTAVVVFNFKVK